MVRGVLSALVSHACVAIRRRNDGLSWPSRNPTCCVGGIQTGNRGRDGRDRRDKAGLQSKIYHLRARGTAKTRTALHTIRLLA